LSKVAVIIPASGSGSRFGGKVPKQFLKIRGKEIIAMTIEKFERNRSVDSIVVTAMPAYFKILNEIIKKYKFKKVTNVVRGGKRRQDSVFNALRMLKCSAGDIILIHDAVRPLVTNSLISGIINSIRNCDAVVPGLPVHETVKRTDDRSIVSSTIDRKNLWLIQTPQAFKYSVLKKSFAVALNKNFTGTDESAIAEIAGFKVRVIEGERTNIKITTKDDIKIFRKK